jgi:hypothetical protein
MLPAITPPMENWSFTSKAGAGAASVINTEPVTSIRDAYIESHSLFLFGIKRIGHGWILRQERAVSQ